MQAAAASDSKDVEGDESLRSFVHDLDDVLGVQWPSASPAARAQDWLPALTRAVSENRIANSVDKKETIPPVPHVTVSSTRQPLEHHGRLLPLPQSSKAAQHDASKPHANLVERGTTTLQHLQPTLATDDSKVTSVLLDEPYGRQNLELFQASCERIRPSSPLIQLPSPHPDLDPLYCERPATSHVSASDSLPSSKQPSILDSQPFGADAALPAVGQASPTPSTSATPFVSAFPAFRSALDMPAVVTARHTPMPDSVRTASHTIIRSPSAYAVADTDDMPKSSSVVQKHISSFSSNRTASRSTPHNPLSEIESLLRLAGITTVRQLQLLVPNSTWLDKLVAEMAVQFPDHLRSFGDRFYLKQSISRVLRMSDPEWS